MKKINRISAVSVTALLAFTVMGCSPQSGGTPSEEMSLKVGTQPWLGYGPWYIAKDQGFDRDNGVEIELTNFSTDDQLNAALAGGSLDAANVATHTALKLLEAGADISIVFVEDISTSADAIAASGIASVKELKGTEIAYEEGTTSDILLNAALAENGMTIDDVQRVPLAAADAGGALVAGRVPVAVTYQPYLSEAVASNPDVKIIYEAGNNPGLISDVFIVDNKVIAKNPKKVQAAVNAWFDSIDFYQKSTAKAQAIIATGVGSDPENLQSAFEGVKFYDRSENEEYLTSTFQEEILPMVLKAGIQSKILRTEVGIKKVVDPQFVKASTAG